MKLMWMSLIATLACAQSTASWENLSKLRRGQKIQIVQKDLKSWTGPFASVSDDFISLKAPDGDRTVARADVMRHGGKRLHNALIGAGAGGVAGVVVGAASSGCSRNSIGVCVGRGAAAAVVGGFGALVGGGVGAAIPGNTAIYRAASLPAQRDHGVDPHRAARGNIAGEHGDGRPAE